MSTFRFVTGMPVAHIALLSQKLFIKDIKWKSKKDEEGNSEKYFDGVIVNWQFNNELKEAPFHAGLIVPWHIAKMGEQVSNEWLYENNNSLYKKVNEMEQIANKVAEKIAAKY